MKETKSYLILVSMVVVILASCTLVTKTPNPACPPADQYCSPLSLTLTGAAVTSAPGDLGWGDVRGIVTDTITGAPIAGAYVTCQHTSNHPIGLCSGSTTTTADGRFVFPHVFFQNTDRIELTVNNPNYGSQFFRQEYFTQPSLYINLSLPLIDLTPHPCCTAPHCSENETYSCPGVCTCGCGTICVTKTITPIWMNTQTPTITPTPVQLTPATPIPIITSTPPSFPCLDCNSGPALLYLCPLASNSEQARKLLNPYGEVLTGEIGNHSCLYASYFDGYITYVYYVDQATGEVKFVLLDPYLLTPPSTSPTP